MVRTKSGFKQPDKEVRPPCQALSYGSSQCFNVWGQGGGNELEGGGIKTAPLAKKIRYPPLGELINQKLA